MEYQEYGEIKFSVRIAQIIIGEIQNRESTKE